MLACPVVVTSVVTMSPKPNFCGQISFHPNPSNSHKSMLMFFPPANIPPSILKENIDAGGQKYLSPAKPETKFGEIESEPKQH